MSDLYADTLETTRIPGLPRLRISTAVMEMVTGARYLAATMSLTTDDAGTCMQVTVPLDPCTMRALARVLNEHATRIGVELIPLLNAARTDPVAAIHRALEADHVG
jgi:hypothetical protein